MLFSSTSVLRQTPVTVVLWIWLERSLPNSIRTNAGIQNPHTYALLKSRKSQNVVQTSSCYWCLLRRVRWILVLHTHTHTRTSSHWLHPIKISNQSCMRCQFRLWNVLWRSEDLAVYASRILTYARTAKAADLPVVFYRKICWRCLWSPRDFLFFETKRSRCVSVICQWTNNK